MLAILTMLALVALALALGDALRRALGVVGPVAERIAIAGGLGIGALSLAAFGLAVVGQFRPVPVLVVALVLAAVGIAFRDRKPTRLALSREHIPFTAAMALPVAALLPFLPAPELGFDAVYYHLPIARDLARLGTLPYEPYLIFSAFPLGADVLYGVAALFDALDAARVLQFAAGILAAFAAYALAARLRGARAGWLAAFTWLATPLVLKEMAMAYVDLVAALFGGLACLFALRWLESRAGRDALLVGIFLGLGLGTKLTVALAAAPLLLGLAALSLRRSRAIPHVALAASAAALVASPHYARAWILTGNPVFPYFNGVFRSPLWFPFNDTFDHQSFGAGSGAADFVLLPLRLVVEPGRFDQSPLPYLLWWPMFVAIALAFALRPRAGRASWLLAFVVFGATALWFAYGQYVRYLLPVFPIGAALAGCTIASLFDAGSRAAARLLGRVTLVGGSFAAAVVFLALSWNVLDPFPFRYDVGLESRDAYLTRNFRHYAMYRWLSTLDPAGPILGLRFSEAPIVYSDVPIYRAETTFAGRKILTVGDPRLVPGVTRAAGFRYVLLDRAAHGFDPKGPNTLDDMVRGLELVHEEGVLALYAVPP